MRDPAENPLDLAWERINALGGTSDGDAYELGYIHAIGHALEIIEQLGGSDPLPKRNPGAGAERSPGAATTGICAPSVDALRAEQRVQFSRPGPLRIDPRDQQATVKIALVSLTNEVRGVLNKWPMALRETIGNTNFACIERRVAEATIALAESGDTPHPDPRDPDPTREGIFRDHNCSPCNNGKTHCVQGSPALCKHPHARND